MGNPRENGGDDQTIMENGDCVEILPETPSESIIDGTRVQLNHTLTGIDCDYYFLKADGCAENELQYHQFEGGLLKFKGRLEVSTDTNTQTSYRNLTEGEAIYQVKLKDCQNINSHRFAVQEMIVEIVEIDVASGSGLVKINTQGTDVNIKILKGKWRIISPDGQAEFPHDQMIAGTNVTINSEQFSYVDGFRFDPQFEIDKIGDLPTTEYTGADQANSHTEAPEAPSFQGQTLNGCHVSGPDVGLIIAVATVAAKKTMDRTFNTLTRKVIKSLGTLPSEEEREK